MKLGGLAGPLWSASTPTRRCLLPCCATDGGGEASGSSSSSSIHHVAFERGPGRQPTVSVRASQLSTAVQVQVHPPSSSTTITRGPLGPPVAQPDRLTYLQPQQPWYVQESHVETATAAPTAAEGSNTTTNSRDAIGSPLQQSKQQRRKRHKTNQQHQQQLQGTDSSEQQQQQLAKAGGHHLGVPVKYQPCGKKGGLKLAASLSKKLQQGRQVLLPAGAGMQLVRTTAMLSSARSMLLSTGDGSTSLAFQPSFSIKAGSGYTQRAAIAPKQRQAAVAAHHQHPGHDDDAAAASARASSSNGASTSGRTGSSGGTSSSSGSTKGVMLLVSALPDAQLRRFDQQPLIAARSTRTPALAAAMFARVCKQGFTSVRAAGPEATRLAMLAAAEARSKLLGCGLDLAVVPATDLVDVDSLAGPDGPPQYVELEAQEGQEGLGPGEEVPTQFVRVTVLHIVRCEPQQPWQLLPWPVPAEQLPAVRHPQQQQQQQQREQQRQVVMEQQQDKEPQQHQHQYRHTVGMTGDRFAQQPQSQPQHTFAPSVLRATHDVASLLLHEQHQQLLHYAQLSPAASAQPWPSSVHAVEGLAPAAAAVGDDAQVTREPAIEGDGAASTTSLPPAVSEQSLSAAAAAAAAWAASEAQHADGRVYVQQSDDVGILRLQPDTTAPMIAGQGGNSSSNIVVRPPGGVLLQHKHSSKKGSRQLVAAAQAGGGGATAAGGRGSS